MKTPLLGSGMIEFSLENEDRCTGGRPSIIKSAGEPLFVLISARDADNSQTQKTKHGEADKKSHDDTKEKHR